MYTLILLLFRFFYWFFFLFPSRFVSFFTGSSDPFSNDPFASYLRENAGSIQVILGFSFFISLIPFLYPPILNSYYLTYGSLIPLFFIFFIFFAPSSFAPRLVALGGSIFTFFWFSPLLDLLFNDDISVPSYYFSEEIILWLSQFGGFNYHLAIDAVSIYFITLTNFVIIICILASWNTPLIREKQYFASFLFINTLLIHVFTQINFFLFFLFFEAVLIPMFFIIGIWGSRTQRIGAAYRFFLYTLAGSSFFLAALSYLYVQFGTLDLTDLLFFMVTKTPVSIDFSVQLLIWFLIFIGFAVKIPLVPVHTWLPEAHVEAPTAGSMLLAAVLLKMGGYGVFRFLLPLFPDATTFFFPLTATLCVLSIIYGSAAALVHQDMKKIVAYSSVAHMGYSMLGVFTMTHAGIYGGLGSMISHGLISTALFFSVGLLYERYGTRNITSYGSIALIYPIFSFYFFVFCLANTGFPGTSSFFPEIAVLTGLSVTNLMATILSASSVVLSAAYSLWLFGRVCFATEGFQPTAPTLRAHGDLSYRESYIAGILLFFIVVVFGLFPAYFFGPLEQPVTFLLSLIPFTSKLF
jgi:NADH-quinone oxidoreductase subunit M